MNKDPIIIVDDDEDDIEILKESFVQMKIENEIIVFTNGFKFLEYMWTTKNKTFFILCDMTLAVISGLELKRKIFEDTRLRMKCIPFILSSTITASPALLEAYSFGVQGYFIKPNNLKEYSAMLKAIVTYWSLSQHPNS